MRHLTKDELSAQLDRALTGRAAEAAERHLADCEKCRGALATLVAQDAALRPVLTHDPGENYFASFLNRVEDRIRTNRAEAFRRGTGFDAKRFFSSPRVLATAGAVAVVVVGAGLALMTRREIAPPDLRDRELAQRARQTVSRVTPPKEASVPAADSQAAPPESASVPESAAAQPLAENDELKDQDAASKQETAAGGETPVAAKNGEFAAPPPATAPPPVTAQAERADQKAATAPSAPSTRAQASAGRAVEVRRNQSGEDIPVNTRSQPPLPTKPKTSADAGTGQLRKKLAAEPLRDALKRAAPGAPSGAASNEEKTRRESNLRPMQAPAAGAAPLAPTATVAADKAHGYRSLAAAELRLCGEVRDRSGRPVAGAQVSLADLGRTASTDAQGAFCIAAPPGEHGLSVMAVGFGEKRQTVHVGGDQEALRVTLEAVPVLDGKLGMVAPGADLHIRGGRADEVKYQFDEGFDSLPKSIRSDVRAAQQLEASAAAHPSALSYDVAAASWEHALRRLENQPAELDVRWHIAQARFHAWERGRNSHRTEAAIGALTAYALRAPSGPGREQAARWLDQVRR